MSSSVTLPKSHLGTSHTLPRHGALHQLVADRAATAYLTRCEPEDVDRDAKILVGSDHRLGNPIRTGELEFGIMADNIGAPTSSRISKKKIFSIKRYFEFSSWILLLVYL